MKKQITFVAVLMTLVWAGGKISQLPNSPVSLDSELTSPQIVSQPQPGLRATIDPETRKFVAEPAAVDHPPVIEDELNYSSAGLEERASEVEGGGVMVDLRGRFQNTTVVTIGSDGKLNAPCVPARADEAGAQLERAENGDEDVAEGGDEQ